MFLKVVYVVLLFSFDIFSPFWQIVQIFPRFFEDQESIVVGISVSIEEVESVLKGFSKYKSPGLDGWSVELFLEF